LSQVARPHDTTPAHPAPSEFDPLASRVAGYLKPKDISLLHHAFEFSKAAHEGQFRKSGEAYIHHPVAVACNLADWHLDAQALAAALLHDVAEDTDIGVARLEAEFGHTIAHLVDGVSKLDRLTFQSDEQAQAENFRKMLLAMERDIRVILIKLADRLHNMHTLAAMPPDKRRRIASETLDIYAPIANRLGLHAAYQELEDLAFRHSHPAQYRMLASAVRARRGNRKELVAKIKTAIETRLRDAGIEAEVKGREKHLYSIHRKMQEKSLDLSEVFDIYGFRVIVRDAPSCYLALGALHGLFRPLPGKFKDYIALPKANGYQSLHSTLLGPSGTPIEAQIRSQDMHKLAEAGVAAHWLYKGGALDDMERRTHQWLQSLLEIQSESGNAPEFLEHIKVDLFPDEVYVFTPKGKIMPLPRGATAVDFAYAVHTDVGNRCVAVKVNHELMPLRTQLRNGDHVEIIDASNAHPNPAWLNFAVTGRARAAIRHALRAMHRSESTELGRALLDHALGLIGGEGVELGEVQWERLLRDSGAKTRDDILDDIAQGRRQALPVARQLLLKDADAEPRAHAAPLMISGAEGVAVQLGKCCQPIPGDPIIGVISKGAGLVVHTHDCPAIRGFRNSPEKWVDVAWEAATDRLYDVNVKLIVAHKLGVLARVAAEIASQGANIGNVYMEEEDGSRYSILYFTLQVQNRLHLARILKDLRKQPEVVRIRRIKGRKDGRAQGQ
jgi:GTP pyrophosphokinase